MLKEYLSYLNLSKKEEMEKIYLEHDLSKEDLAFEKDILLVFEYLDLLPKIKKEILSFYKCNQENKQLLESLVLIRWFTVEHAHPSMWLIEKEPQISGIDSGAFAVLSLILISAFQLRIYVENKIDEKHIYFNFNHLKNYINNYYIETNKIGTSNYTWNIYLASLGLIHLHTLHFMHHVYTDRFVILKHNQTNEKIVLALAGIEVR